MRQPHRQLPLDVVLDSRDRGRVRGIVCDHIRCWNAAVMGTKLK
jgi:hypothetical protein